MSSRLDTREERFELVDEFKKKCKQVGGETQSGLYPEDVVKCVVDGENEPKKELRLALFDRFSGPHASLKVYPSKKGGGIRGAQASGSITMNSVKGAEIDTHIFNEERDFIVVRNGLDSLSMRGTEKVNE